jgi:hypothetical protein
MLTGEQCPAPLEQVVLRCLEKNPDNRYDSAAALAVALRGIDLAAAPPKARRGALFSLAGLLLIGASAAAVYAVWNLRQERQDTVEQQAIQRELSTSITVEFNSSPPGAEVYRAGETIPLGLTPFNANFTRSNNSMEVLFVLDGHEDVEVEVSLNRAVQVVATLPALPVDAAPITADAMDAGVDDLVDNDAGTAAAPPTPPKKRKPPPNKRKPPKRWRPKRRPKGR